MRLFVDNLTNIDFSYFCPKRGLVGETWLASIELVGQLDEQGMVCDFGIVKKTIRTWLDTKLDHCLLVPASHPGVSVSSDEKTCQASLADGTECKAPKAAITPIPISDINMDSVARWAEAALMEIFSNDLAVPLQGLTLRFQAEPIEGSYYHYSHGLKKHKGACQRIAHGHRSRLLIWRNGELCEKSIKVWCARFRDIYIASREDMSGETATHFQFAYEAQQGAFFLSVAKERCYFIDTESTVEYIAQHLLDTMGQHYPNEQFTVKAFEGIGKGALIEGQKPLDL